MCRDCGRLGREIAGWSGASQAQRLAVRIAAAACLNERAAAGRLNERAAAGRLNERAAAVRLKDKLAAAHTGAKGHDRAP